MATNYTKLMKKKDLETVWKAACCSKRLKRDVIEQTNISSSVDKIDQLKVAPYRILGFLLLGIVIIYSKKVEYVLHDGSSLLEQMRDLLEKRKRSKVNFIGMCMPETSSGNRANSFVESMRRQFSSISIPDNFQLDAFDLEILEAETREHVKPRKEITLNAAWRDERSGDDSCDEDHEEVSASFSDYAAAYDLIMNVNQRISETSAEKLRYRFSLGESLDPVVLREADEETEPVVRPSGNLQEPGKNTVCLVNEVLFEVEDEHLCKEGGTNNERSDEEECKNGETMGSEMTLLETMRIRPSPDHSPLSVHVNLTPDSKAPVASGKAKPEFAAVHTPASKERVRAPRKRKGLYDEKIVIPNNVYKDWLANSSDLVRKRKVAPTSLVSWKERRILDLQHGFLEPVVPIPAGLSLSINKLQMLEAVDDLLETSSEVNGLGSPNILTTLEEETEAMAPSTPVTVAPSMPVRVAPSTAVPQSTSSRFGELHGMPEANQMGPASSSDRGIDEVLMSEVTNAYLYRTQSQLSQNQEDAEESHLFGGNSEENILLPDKWSATTKSVASYLHGNFLQQKERKEKERLSLFPALKDKTKGESAKFFYELLVLKTGGFIEVEQEKAYGDIFVTETSKLKKAFETDRNFCS